MGLSWTINGCKVFIKELTPSQQVRTSECISRRFSTLSPRKKPNEEENVDFLYSDSQKRTEKKYILILKHDRLSYARLYAHNSKDTQAAVELIGKKMPRLESELG